MPAFEKIDEFTPIECTDRHGKVNTFYWTFDGGVNGELTYLVYSQERRNGRFFQLSFKPCKEELRLMMITHNYHKEFRAKGIPEALIPLVSKQHRKDITSSTNLKEHKCFPNESRRDVKVDKIFKRLKAEYDKETDLYTYKYQHD